MKLTGQNSKQGIRAITMLLLVVFVFAQFGPFLIYKSKKTIIKHEMREAIKYGKFGDVAVVFNFCSLINNPSFHWEEEGKEFIYRNEKYDVVDVQNKNGKIFVLCINDKKEKDIEQTYARLFIDDFNCTKGGAKSKTVLSVFINDYLLLNSFHNDIIHKNVFFSYSNLIAQFEPGVVSPPPNFIM